MSKQRTARSGLEPVSKVADLAVPWLMAGALSQATPPQGQVS